LVILKGDRIFAKLVVGLEANHFGNSKKMLELLLQKANITQIYKVLLNEMFQTFNYIESGESLQFLNIFFHLGNKRCCF
jgi:hypothetical protein